MRTDDHSPDFITVDEAARLVQRSHWTVRRWLVSGGKLTRYKSLSRAVVRRSDLLELVRPKESIENNADVETAFRKLNR